MMEEFVFLLLFQILIFINYGTSIHYLSLIKILVEGHLQISSSSDPNSVKVPPT